MKYFPQVKSLIKMQNVRHTTNISPLKMVTAA
jgi:hypothetical protein